MIGRSMDFLCAAFVVYLIVELIINHRERMAKIALGQSDEDDK